jgi:hypothetical protein
MAAAQIWRPTGPSHTVRSVSGRVGGGGCVQQVLHALAGADGGRDHGVSGGAGDRGDGVGDGLPVAQRDHASHDRGGGSDSAAGVERGPRGWAAGGVRAVEAEIAPLGDAHCSPHVDAGLVQRGAGRCHGGVDSLRIAVADEDRGGAAVLGDGDRLAVHRRGQRPERLGHSGQGRVRRSEDLVARQGNEDERGGGVGGEAHQVRHKGQHLGRVAEVEGELERFGGLHRGSFPRREANVEPLVGTGGRRGPGRTVSGGAHPGPRVGAGVDRG